MKISVLSLTVFILFQILFVSTVSAQTGLITGTVTDSKTHEPLPGVNIVINEIQNLGAASDINGKFEIKIPAGSYSLKASLIGYTSVVKTDMIVRTGDEVKVMLQLSETTIDMKDVVVSADYFDKSIIENDLSTITLGIEEVRRSPGSSLDVQRILQGMAGVSFSSDRTNELIVRGGAPDETLVMLDNMEIHSINHFPNENNSGGAINMFNVALLQNIQFSTGGFISKYGDKLSSVMNIETREGTRSKIFDTNINLSTAGFGAIMEGCIDNGKGSWLLSARNGVLGLIKDAIGKSDVPQYYDIQFKLAYDLSTKHKLSMSGIFGSDKIFEEAEFDDTKLSSAGKIDSSSQSGDKIKQSQYAAGLSLRSTWSNNLYSLFTVYINNYHYDINETEQFAALQYGNNGDLVQTTVLNEKALYNDLHDQGEAAIKGEFVWNINKSNELNFGGSLKTTGFRQSIYLGGDSTRYDIQGNGWNTPDDIYVGDKSSQLEYDIEYFKNLKSYLFVNNKTKFFDGRLILNLGLRYDYFTYSGKGNLSPRISASFSLFPGITNINFAYGEYYQTHNFSLYNDKYKLGINQHLDNTHARHFVIGLDQILSEGLKLTLEMYSKKYFDIPVSEDFIHFNDRTFRSVKYLNIGRKYCYGIDLLIQQKLVKDIFGTLAYSRMWSKYDDPRIGMEGNLYPSEYEYPNVFTLIFGKRFANLRDKLDKSAFYIKYPSYLLPFSNDMEISVRWRYASGRAFTPKTFVTNEQHYEGEIKWSKGNWVSVNDINSARYPDYHRLDIAFSSRYNFSKWSLTVFLSIENIYNRKNIARYRYKSSGKIENVYQFSLLPVAGVEIRF